MGGLVVFPHHPAPSYVWEMLHAYTGELFMHFDVRGQAEYLSFRCFAASPCVLGGKRKPWGNH